LQAISLTDDDFTAGGLQRSSHARPGKLFTAHYSLFAVAVGTLTPEKLQEARDALIAMIRGK
jgi:mRNA interferase MazF